MEKHRFGAPFKEMRLLTKTKYADLSDVMGKNTIVKFESGDQMLAFDKLMSALNKMGFDFDDFLYFSKVHPVEPNYGRTFYTIRVQRGCCKDFFITNGVSPMRLDLFETGRIMLSYNTIDAMLSSMRVPEGDFEYALTDQENYFIQTVDQLDMAIRTKNFLYCREVEHSAHEYESMDVGYEENEAWLSDKDLTEGFTDEEIDYLANAPLTRQFADYRVLELTAKSSYERLSEEELIELGDFFMGLQIWVEYSLGLLAINAWQLPYITLYGILTDILTTRKRYINKSVYRLRVLQIGERAALSEATKGNIEHAENLLALVKSFAFSVDTHSQGMYRFAQEFVDWKKGKIEAKTEMLRVIAIFDYLGEKVSFNFANDYYEKYVMGKVV